LGILWEFFGNSAGILREFCGNSLGILWEFFGSSLKIQFLSINYTNLGYGKILGLKPGQGQGQGKRSLEARADAFSRLNKDFFSYEICKKDIQYKKGFSINVSLVLFLQLS